MKMKTLLAAAFVATGLGSGALAAPLCTDFGFAGLLAACNRGEEPIRLTLASGQPLGEDQVLQSGAYYDVWLDGEKFVTAVKEVGAARWEVGC